MTDRRRLVVDREERKMLSLALMTCIQRLSLLPTNAERSRELRVMRSLLERFTE